MAQLLNVPADDVTNAALCRELSLYPLFYWLYRALNWVTVSMKLMCMAKVSCRGINPDG